ncbi:MAG: two-component system sensor histidine kinase NtrB [Chitinophagaceae bacterium]
MIYAEPALTAKTVKTAVDNYNLNLVCKAPKMMNNIPGQIISTLAHEVRNPLTNINLSVDLLELEVPDDNRQKYLDIIRRSCIKINGLINLLIKEQQDDVLPLKQSMEPVLDNVLKIVGDRIILKHISVCKDYTKQDFQLVVNEPKMTIALTNIIINAIDAMPSKGGILQLTTIATGGKYEIHIADNGCGIKKENLKNIFKPYYTNKPNGLGLGLALTYNILKSNDVEVNVVSEEGRGTCFFLYFKKIRNK